MHFNGYLVIVASFRTVVSSCVVVSVSRVYWSTFDARRRCVYTCRIVQVVPKAKHPEVIADVTITHDEHDPNYDAVLAATFIWTPTPIGDSSAFSDEGTLSASETDDEDTDLTDEFRSPINAAASENIWTGSQSGTSHSHLFNVGLEHSARENNFTVVSRLVKEWEESAGKAAAAPKLGFVQSLVGLSASSPASLNSTRFQAACVATPSETSRSICDVLTSVSRSPEIPSPSAMRQRSSNLSFLSPSTLKMLGLPGSPSTIHKSIQPMPVIAEPLGTDDGLALMQIVHRLNQAAAKNREWTKKPSFDSFQADGSADDSQASSLRLDSSGDGEVLGELKMPDEHSCPSFMTILSTGTDFHEAAESKGLGPKIGRAHV